MKKFFILCLMAFVMCSCNTEKKLMRESIETYEIYDITDFHYYWVINSYNDYIVTLKQTIYECDKKIKEESENSPYLALTPKGQVLLYNSALRKVMLEDIKEKTIDLLENATEENFTPKYYCRYEYEYHDRSCGMTIEDTKQYTKYVLLEYSNSQNAYVLHLLTDVFIMNK